MGYWSELFLSVSLVVVGTVTLGLHIFQVLKPDWQESRPPAGFVPGKCVVTRLIIHEWDQPLDMAQFDIEIQAARILDDGSTGKPVWIERKMGYFSPTRDDAEQIAEDYQEGTELACWYNPDEPSQLVLRRSIRWWVWPVTLIPASLLAVGIFGIVASLMQVATSAERRSLVAVKAMRLDPLRDSPDESKTLPTGLREDESPGIRYAHRLPAVGTAGWRMAGLMIVCAIWNALLAFFVYVASLQYLNSKSPWLALGLVVLLGMVGVWLAFNLIREFWNRRGIGQSHVEISAHPLMLGCEYQAYLMQTGNMTLRKLLVELVCEESASYQQGTDSRTSVEVVYRQELRKWRGLRVEAAQPFEAEMSFSIPASAMHSFRSPHNQIRWMLLVRGETSRHQEVYRQFGLLVQPPRQRGNESLIAASDTADMEPMA
ncbi:hypothetical protein NG895_28730 [Aeoliella sp. ICT_H6.2]|uniref:DUF3592 domain-containing protein n=1 Tax=Aeoliella straminimaris TaxID=2954799 RepID=A0A9X2JL22_9BACT|nr:hypothetical protein [Aeoliella straminimaris]MCO6047909.1 hypothetical protein [Aeoliella straminimaris]